MTNQKKRLNFQPLFFCNNLLHKDFIVISCCEKYIIMHAYQIHSALLSLRPQFKGDILIDETIRILYATDASAYRELPIAVVRPMDSEDIRLLIYFAA